MANSTKCLTPGTRFITVIDGDVVSIEARLPFELDIDEEEAVVLETLLHNLVEATLRPYFKK